MSAACIRATSHGHRTQVPRADDRLVFVDLETTGGQSWRPIMQVAAIAVTITGEELETFERKLCFDFQRATKRALRKRQSRQREWRHEARNPHEVAREFAEFLKRHATLPVTTCHGKPLMVAKLVAHNAAFDGPFLRDWFRQQQRFLPADYRIFCTLQRTLWWFHERPDWPPPRDFRQGTLCQYFGLPWMPSQAHDALADVRATVALYRHLQSLASADDATHRDVSAA